MFWCMYDLWACDSWHLSRRQNERVCIFTFTFTFKVLCEAVYIFLYVSRCVLCVFIVFSFWCIISLWIATLQVASHIFSYMFLYKASISVCFAFLFLVTWGIAEVHRDSDPSLEAHMKQFRLCLLLECLVSNFQAPFLTRLVAPVVCQLVAHTPSGEVAVALVRQQR